jgi:peroxiredoxin
MLKSHNVMLNGLAPGTVFHYKVTSRDASGNEASSKDYTFTTPAQQSSGNSIIGTQAPDFTLNSVDGSSVTLSSFKGKKIIINFWNLDCQYCMKEMPDFQSIRNNNPNIVMLMINTAYGGFTVDSTAVAEAVASRNYTFTVLLDESGSQARAYHFAGLEEGIPFTFFLNGDGVIKAYQDGMFSSSAAIQNMLGSY